jgi:hypothetical protein
VPVNVEPPLVAFEDNDRDYLFWTRQNSRGHVVNCYRNPTPDREFYASPTPGRARLRLTKFYAHAKTAKVPEVARLARTIKPWELQILTIFATGVSNAGSEAQNLVTEKLRRNVHGFRNFENYRLRLLLHCGVKWNTPSTARIRGRQPHLIA